MTSEKELSAELIEKADLVIITTAHSNIDYELVQRHAKSVFDTKNVMRNVKERTNIEIL